MFNHYKVLWVIYLKLSIFSVIFVSCSSFDNIDTPIDPDNSEGFLFSKDFCIDSSSNDFIGVNGTNNYICSLGLVICDPRAPIVLLREYSLADRTIEMHCVLSSNSVFHITHSYSGIKYIIDINNKCLYADNKTYHIDFLEEDRDFVISLNKHYQEQSIIIKDINSKKENIITFVNNGQGGVGRGAVNNTPILYEMPHGLYTLTCTSGEVICKRIAVFTSHKKIKLLLYADSITETEVYYPCSSFLQSWPQLVSQAIPYCVTSGYSGKTIDGIIPIIKNELPFLDVEYVMLTIGTNGGNTIENLSEIIEYILFMGAKPLLNHIPCNENYTQGGVNELIDRVRQKYSIVGADFDIATVDEYGGVNKTKMFWEDYGPDYQLYSHDYWHHPNELGSRAMFNQIRNDIPELFAK